MAATPYVHRYNALLPETHRGSGAAPAPTTEGAELLAIILADLRAAVDAKADRGQYDYQLATRQTKRLVRHTRRVRVSGGAEGGGK